jgi:peptidyl-prolyl cis-trans isomerase SurA
MWVSNVLDKGSIVEMIMKTLKFPLLASFLLAASLGTSAPAFAAVDRDIEGIAAIVNDQVISLFDVDQRVDLFFVTSGLEKSPEMRERIRQQVLRSLVDEKLQMQEARRVEIEIEENEISDSVKRLAKENKMSYEGIQEFLGENDIQESTLKAQIESELAWNQFVRRSFGGRLTISEQEVDEQFEKAVRSVNEPRYQVSEILLNVDSFANDERVAEISNTIVEQLQNGVDFGAVARQFSIAPSASDGGQLGWVAADQLDDVRAAVVTQMQPGEISRPFRTQEGVYIIGLADSKQGGATDAMKNRFDVLTIGFAGDTASKTVSKFVDDFKTCRSAQRSAKQLGANAKRSGLKELRELPAALHAVLSPLEAGSLAMGPDTEAGSEIYIVCDRKDDQGIQISREAISDNIFGQRLAMMARRHLRDLRREAVVEYR